MAKGMRKITGGWQSWRWLSGIDAKQRSWLLGAIGGRNGYQAWAVYLTKGLQDNNFLLEFERTTDPWQKSKLVGERIKALSQGFLKLSEEEKSILSRDAEVELRTALTTLGRDKRLIAELVELVDPPTVQE
jgi:hypothetical protein